MMNKPKSGRGVMIPKKARMAKGGAVKTKKANGGGVMVPRAARRTK